MVISSFPPEVCGIATSAVAEAKAFEAAGATVVRVPLHDLRADRWAGSAMARLESACATADRVILHYQSAMFRDVAQPRWVLQVRRPHVALARLLRPRRDRVECVVHELPGPPPGASADLVGRLLRHYAKLLMRACGTLVFHTVAERAAFAAALYQPPRALVEPQDAYFHPNSARGKAQARATLGLPPSQPLVLCIGFIAPPKGFAEFAAVARLGWRDGWLAPDARLHIVTSVREADPLATAALARLRAEAAAEPRVVVHEGHVSDEAFDDWLVACDVLVLPYLSSHSSAVLGRARMLGVRTIVTAVGGLAEQAGPDGLVVAQPSDWARLLPAALATAPRAASGQA